jgi:Fe-S-cluster containining protein
LEKIVEVFDMIPAQLEGSSLEMPLSRLAARYERIEIAQRRWIGLTPYRCPDGCGKCCAKFEPELTEVEALFLAAWILRNEPALLDGIQLGSEQKACVLSDPDAKFHCRVYGGRPLICRLFAFSGDKAKDGTARFRTCEHMPHSGDRILAEAVLRSLYGELPPLMSDFASEADLLMPDYSGKRTPLRLALPGALSKISMLCQFSDFAQQKS